MPRRDTVSKYVCAAVFILMEVAAFALLTHGSQMQHLWLIRTTNSIRGAVWGTGENIANYFSLRKLNDNLAEENYQLHLALRAIQEEEAEEEAAGSAARMSGIGHFKYTAAKIVKMSRNSQHNYIILNKGSEDGIRPQSGIITPSGVVGIVDAVGKHFCYGISFMNTGMSISGRIGRDGITGPLVWKGTDMRTAVLKEIPLQYEIAPGDTVWTSGFSSIFPSDVPLGTTAGVRRVNGTVNEVTVNLFEDFSALRNVMVADNLGRDEIRQLEQMEEGL